MENERPCWIVWSPNGPYSPQVRHSDEPTAWRVAKSMGERYPGQKFYVMEAKGFAVTRDPVTLVRFGSSGVPVEMDEIPF